MTCINYIMMEHQKHHDKYQIYLDIKYFYFKDLIQIVKLLLIFYDSYQLYHDGSSKPSRQVSNLFAHQIFLFQK